MTFRRLGTVILALVLGAAPAFGHEPDLKRLPLGDTLHSSAPKVGHLALPHRSGRGRGLY